jgi:preprotein translocase subunit SecB
LRGDQSGGDIMSDDAASKGTPEPTPAAERPAPQIRLHSQYVKDLSFESPRVPRQLPHMIQAPKIEISVNVNATPVNEEGSQVEVELKLEARATKDDDVVFIAEIVYAGVIGLINVGDDIRQPLILIEGPRLIFPFARRILADVVRDGGFPPMLVDPIDFAALYRHHLMQLQQRQQAGTAPN